MSAVIRLDAWKSHRHLKVIKGVKSRRAVPVVGSVHLRNIMVMQEQVRALVSVLYNPDRENSITDAVHVGTTTISRRDLYGKIMETCDAIVVDVAHLKPEIYGR